MLFFDEFVVGDVGCEEGVFVGGVGAFGNVSKTGTKLVLGVFAGNEAAVAGDLCAGVRCHIL